MTRIYSIQRSPFRPSVLCFNGNAIGDIASFYFDPPTADVVGTLLNERGQDSSWRSPKRFLSGTTYSDAENDPRISDPDGEYIDSSGHAYRLEHNVLYANTFALHPLFGTGHVLRTDGRIAAFWNGERCYIVHLTNLHFLRVAVSVAEKPMREKPLEASPRAKAKAYALALALLQ